MYHLFDVSVNKRYVTLRYVTNAHDTIQRTTDLNSELLLINESVADLLFNFKMPS